MEHVFSTLISGMLMLAVLAFFATHIVKVAGKAVANGDGSSFMRCLGAGVIMVIISVCAIKTYAWSAQEIAKRELGAITTNNTAPWDGRK